MVQRPCRLVTVKTFARSATFVARPLSTRARSGLFAAMLRIGFRRSDRLSTSTVISRMSRLLKGPETRGTVAQLESRNGAVIENSKGNRIIDLTSNRPNVVHRRVYYGVHAGD